MTNEDQKVLDFLVYNPEYGKTSVTLASLKRIMLYTDGRLMSKGRFFDISSKRLCPGVYQVSLTRR